MRIGGVQEGKKKQMGWLTLGGVVTNCMQSYFHLSSWLRYECAFYLLSTIKITQAKVPLFVNLIIALFPFIKSRGGAFKRQRFTKPQCLYHYIF